MLTSNHTVLPATHTFIHEWNEPSCLYSSAGASGVPHNKNCPPPLGGAVAMVFRNVSLAMCPLKLSLAPYLPDSGAGSALLSAAEDHRTMAGNHFTSHRG